jgi:protocatechuate 3,4-dioxygenase beta subunit
MAKHGNLVALFLVLAALAAAGFFLLSGGGGGGTVDAPESPTPDSATLSAAQPELHAAAETVRMGPARSTIEQPVARPELDPDIVAALAKFTGRVVAHDGKPVAQSKVRLFRLDPQVVFQPSLSILTEPITDVADAFAGEATTGGDGRFELAGVWPRSIYLFKADADGENPTVRINERTPGPGETVDLGDLVLKNGAVVTGTVVDDEGQPLAGAMVRAADVPPIATQFIPIEQIDPEGWIIVGDAGAQTFGETGAKMVIEAPAWIAKLWRELPIPTTVSGSDGSFRLQGIEPGINLIAATKAGYVAATQKNVKLDAGKTRDVGKLKLGEGEVASGRVIDQQGKPIAGVQVVVGNKLTAVPIAFARDAGKSDARGQFACSGLGTGNVVAAARRDAGEPWVITDPQTIQQDIVITMPSRCALTVRLVSESGSVIAAPKMRLLSFGAVTGQDELPIFAQLGFARAVALEHRQSKLPDGRVQLRDLPTGKYALLAGCAGHGQAMTAVDLTGDREVELRLPAERAFEVVVLDDSERPIRNAAVYVELRGKGPEVMPVHAGTTGADGKVSVREVARDQVQVEATHPRFGAAAAAVELPASAPIVIRLRTPAAIAGEVTENGKPPELGKYTVVAQRSWNETRGPSTGMPAMAVPDAEGKFTFHGLQPGSWRVEAIKSLQAMSSFSSMFDMMVMERFAANLPDQEVTLVAGQTAQVRLETNAPRVVDGPSARVAGSVFVNSQAGEGMVVQGWSEQRLSATVDASGRFDLGPVKEGHIYLNVLEPPRRDALSAMDFGNSLWSRGVEVKAGSDVDLRIEINTGGLEGTVLDLEGQPAAGVSVRADGMLAGADPRTPAHTRSSAVTDADGRFAMQRLPACTYTVEAVADKRGRASTTIEVASGSMAQARLQLQRTFTVRGRIDRKLLPQDKEERWLWLAFQREGEEAGRSQTGGSVDGDEDTFEVDGLRPGTYRVRIHGNMKGQWKHDGVVEVTGDVEGFVVRPVEHKVETRQAVKKDG